MKFWAAIIIGAVLIWAGAAYWAINANLPKPDNSKPAPQDSNSSDLSNTTDSQSFHVIEGECIFDSREGSFSKGIYAAPLSGSAPLTVVFNPSTFPKAASDEQLNFGDGESTSNEGPTGGWPTEITHVYSKPGIYHVSLQRFMPSCTLDSLIITVADSELSTYTDPSFGLEFSYNTQWIRIEDPVANPNDYGGGTLVTQVTLIPAPGEKLYVDEVVSNTNSITFYWRSSQTKYYFENGSWFVTGGDAGTGTFPATKVGVTQNGLPIFPGVGGSLFVPLSTTHFVVVTGVGEEVKNIASFITSSQ